VPRSEGERSSLFSAISFLQIRFYKSVGRGSGKDEGRGRLTLFSKSTLQPARPRVATTTNERAPMMQTEPATDGEQLRVKALASRRRVHFAVHDHILINLRLAELHRAQGRLDEAEPLVAEALAMKKRVHGAVNYHTLTILRLAGLYEAQARHDDAEPLYAEALAMKRRVYGAEKDHPGIDGEGCGGGGAAKSVTLNEVEKDIVQEMDPRLKGFNTGSCKWRAGPSCRPW